MVQISGTNKAGFYISAKHQIWSPISSQAQQMDVQRLCSNMGGSDGVHSGQFGKWTWSSATCFQPDELQATGTSRFGSRSCRSLSRQADQAPLQRVGGFNLTRDAARPAGGREEQAHQCHCQHKDRNLKKTKKNLCHGLL